MRRIKNSNSAAKTLHPKHPCFMRVPFMNLRISFIQNMYLADMKVKRMHNMMVYILLGLKMWIDTKKIFTYTTA